MSDTPERIWTSIATQLWWARKFAEDGSAVEYVRADLYARLQEQVEAANADRERWYASSFAATKRAEAAEAERDRLRGALRIIAGLAPCIDNLMGNADIARAALQKEP